MTHEDFSRYEEIKPSSDRSFGLAIVAFFLIGHLEQYRLSAICVG